MPTNRTVADLEARLAERDRENARLRAELRERLDEQAATVEVLAALSRAPADLQGVLDTIFESALRLCDAAGAHVWLVEGERVRGVAGRDIMGGRRALDAPTPSVP